MSSSRSRLPGLDALRGVAALSVVALHSSYMLHGALIVSRGYLAVDFFFMLSGFVLAHGYVGRLRDGLTADDMIKARLHRLYPMVLLGVAAGVAASASAGEPWPRIAETAISGAMLIPTFSGDAAQGLFPIDSPLWSLFWELVASVFLARLLWRLPVRRLVVLQGAFFVALACLALQHGTMELGFERGHMVGGGVRVGFGFTTGMLLHCWWNRAAAPATRVSVTWLAIILVLTLSVSGPLPKGLADLVVAALVLPSIIIVAAGVESIAWPWRLGAVISYPLYALHMPIFRMLLAWKQGYGRLSTEQGIIIGFALSVLAAWLAHQFWDRPVQAWLKANQIGASACPTASNRIRARRQLGEAG